MDEVDNVDSAPIHIVHFVHKVHSEEGKSMKTLTVCLISIAALLQPCFGQKADLSRSIQQNADRYWKDALQIWEWAEPGYQEERSSALLSSLLEDAGFSVQRGVAGIPTAFTATFGSGKPVIGILGEFDALPGLAQEVEAERRRRPGNGYGHGCGHHLFGVGSAAAAVAVAGQIRAGRISGTVRFYGTPAEEGGSAKVYMVRAGLFEDCDAVLHWHPADTSAAGGASSLARIAAKFRFHGKSAHASVTPDQGRSALDAVELMDAGVNLMREHVPDFTRIHYVITDGGGAPNVVPDFAEVYYYVRHPDADQVQDLYRRVKLCAEGAALATETRLEVDFQGGIYNLLPNDALAKVMQSNLEALNDLRYDEAETAFAREIQKTLAKPKPLEQVGQNQDLTGETRRGSTDVGDISWVVPTAGVRIATWVPGTPSHSWQAVACGATGIARKGMILAAKVLAASAWDLYHDPATLAAAKAELKSRLEERPYRPMLEPDQKPPLDYRKPARTTETTEH